MKEINHSIADPTVYAVEMVRGYLRMCNIFSPEAMRAAVFKLLTDTLHAERRSTRGTGHPYPELLRAIERVQDLFAGVEADADHTNALRYCLELEPAGDSVQRGAKAPLPSTVATARTSALLWGAWSASGSLDEEKILRLLAELTVAVADGTTSFIRHDQGWRSRFRQALLARLQHYQELFD
jgi:hypothetical protein